jgi:hypothetical protein
MPEREGTLVAGRYRVLGRLGSGGMGVSHVADPAPTLIKQAEALEA